MGFYQGQLKEVIQYPDLKIEVLQIFREVGNAILFCLLIEQAMVSDTVSEWARIVTLEMRTLYSRTHLGWLILIYT